VVFGNGNIDQPVKINDYNLENVTWFTYLGTVFTYDNNCSQDLWTRISKATEVTKFMENMWKSKNITNDTKNVYWKQQHSKQCNMGMKPGHTTKTSETSCCHLRCTVTEGSCISAGQSEKQTVKYVTLRIEKDLLQRAIQRKLRLFGHKWRMEDNEKLKTLMLGTVDRTNERGRLCGEWMDDIVSWCKTGLQELNSLTQDRKRWKLLTRQAMDTNGRWSHCSWRRRRRRRD